MGLNLGDLKITTSAWEPLENIPPAHAKDGEDRSPALSWSGEPSGTREVAIICHDPDAPLPEGFTHWVLYGIPAGVGDLPEGGGGEYTEGRNDFGDQGYGGPQPPPGHGPHHYYFWVYALDTELGAEEGLTRAELLARLDGHILEQARMIGVYEQ